MPTPSDNARLLRDHALQNEQWLTEADVSNLADVQQLLAATLGGHLLFPAFQFLGGAPHPRLPDLMACLPKDAGGWDAVLWSFEPTRKLGGARPCDLFSTDPGAVVDAARRTFQGDDCDW